MADYDSFPLWLRDPDGTANVDPTTLPISPELAQELLHWADVYDGTLNRADPAEPGFPDPAAEDDFYASGEGLARRLPPSWLPATRLSTLTAAMAERLSSGNSGWTQASIERRLVGCSTSL
jgi:hypothetical protein